MPRNGSGIYTLPAGQPVVTGTVIDSTVHNTFATDVASALSGSLAADGQKAATGNLPMGGNRITGLADAVAATDAVNRQTGDGRYAQLGAANTFTGNSILVEGTSPEIGIRETDATANNRRWSMSANASTFRLAAVLDDGSPGDSILAADRANGTIVNLTIAGTNTSLVGSTSTTIGNGGGSVIFRDVAGCMRNRGSQNNQTTNNSFLSLQQLGGIENGWVGFGSGTNVLTLSNGISGANLNLSTTGGGAVTVNGLTAATQQTGSFTATLTGVSGSTTGTINYRIVGGVCYLWCASSILGTSNSGSFGFTGLPAACRPATLKRLACYRLADSVGDILGQAHFSNSTTVTFYSSNVGTGFVSQAASFTPTGTKGIMDGWCVSYPLD
jgi:hypothetical protein